MLLAQSLEGAQEGVQYVLIEPGRLEFLIVLIGVVVGLSIGRLVNFTAEIVTNRDVVTWHPTFLVYLTALFFYQIYYWWSVWELKAHADEFANLTFLSYLRLLLVPLFLYQATAVMCKDLRDSEEFSMKEHFNSQARAFYLIVAALIVTALLQAIHLWGKTWPEDQVELAIRGGALVIILLALCIRPTLSQGFHFILSLIVLILLAYFIYVRVIIPDLQEGSAWMLPPSLTRGAALAA